MNGVAAVAQPSRAGLQPVDRPQPIAFAIRVQHHVGDADIPVLVDREGLAEALQLEAAGVLGHAGAHHPAARAPRGLHRVGQEVDGVVDGGKERVDLWGERRCRGGVEVAPVGRQHGLGHLHPSLLAMVNSARCSASFIQLPLVPPSL